MAQILWIVIALVAGAILPIQAGLNTQLGKAGESPIHASGISFIVGSLAIELYILLSKQSVSWVGLKNSSPYLWTGGLFGAFYVTAIVLLFHKISPSLLFGLIVAGQMIMSVALDHFNILVTQPHPINIFRIVGIGLIVGGVVLVSKF